MPPEHFPRWFRDRLIAALLFLPVGGLFWTLARGDDPAHYSARSANADTLANLFASVRATHATLGSPRRVEIHGVLERRDGSRVYLIRVADEPGDTQRALDLALGKTPGEIPADAWEWAALHCRDIHPTGTLANHRLADTGRVLEWTDPDGTGHDLPILEAAAPAPATVADFLAQLKAGTTFYADQGRRYRVTW